jgi:hypothetical protein
MEGQGGGEAQGVTDPKKNKIKNNDTHVNLSKSKSKLRSKSVNSRSSESVGAVLESIL